MHGDNTTVWFVNERFDANWFFCSCLFNINVIRPSRVEPNETVKKEKARTLRRNLSIDSSPRENIHRLNV